MSKWISALEQNDEVFGGFWSKMINAYLTFKIIPFNTQYPTDV